MPKNKHEHLTEEELASIAVKGSSEYRRAIMKRDGNGGCNACYCMWILYFAKYPLPAKPAKVGAAR